MKKILVFCDPGIDDSLAIMYAILHPEIELVGIVASYGNVTRETATTNAAYLVQLAGKNDITIISGASKPIKEEELVFYPEIHGGDGIGPISLPNNLQHQSYSFDAIRLIIEKYRNELVIVELGRPTTLATVFILFPDHIEMVHSFYMMGGAFFIPGNATALAEANFNGDPAAANLVLNNAHNLTLTPLNVTKYAILTQEIIDKVANNKKNIFSFIIKPIFQYYYAFYQKSAPGISGAPIHDLLTMMLVVHPEIAHYINHDVMVIEGTDAKGMSYIDYRSPSKTGKTKVAISLEYELFIEKFKNIMLH